MTAAVAVSLATALVWIGNDTRVAAADAAGTGAGSSAVAGERVSPLRVAAELGVVSAQLRLARRYAGGKGTGEDHAKAFALYRRIVEENADVRPRHARARAVVSAVMALADYFRNGIPGAVKADKRRAADLYRYAASYFGEPEAQYRLARMHLEGEGVPRNSRLAINWLTNASKKRHAKAQAVLGDLLWRGAEDVARQPFKGLALLSLGRQNAGGEEETRWINALYAKAYSASQAHERESAAELAARWQPRMGKARETENAEAPALVKPEPVPAAGEAKAASGQKEAAAGAKQGFTNVGMEIPATLR